MCVYLCQSVYLRVSGGSGECLHRVYGMCIILEVASAETAVSHTISFGCFFIISSPSFGLGIVRNLFLNCFLVSEGDSLAGVVQAWGDP